jgi:TonB family protein
MRKKAFPAIVIALFLAAPMAAQAQPCEPDAPLRAMMATHTQPTYPEMSVMTQEQGISLLQVEIGADGVPTNITVLKSSGSVRLDEAARDHVKSFWRWRSPVKNCQPMPVVTGIRITWDLKTAPDTGPAMPFVTLSKADYPPDAFERREQGMTVVSFLLLDKGGMVRMQITKSSGFADLDAKAQDIARTRRWTPVMLDGKPVNTPVFFAVNWQLEPPK